MEIAKGHYRWTSGIVSRKEIIRLYEWLMRIGKIEKNGAAHTRLKELKKRKW